MSIARFPFQTAFQAPPRTPFRRLLHAAAALAVLGTASASATAACTSAGAAPVLNAATGKLEISLGNCTGSGQAWGGEYESAVSQATFYPDTNANYWVAALAPLTGQAAHYEVRGQMPDARFSSLQSYTVDGKTMGLIVDENVTPASTANVNWIRQSGYYPGAGYVNYNTRIRQVGAGGTVGANELPLKSDMLAAAINSNALVAYRVYNNTRANGSPIPAGLTQAQWIARGQVALPEIVYVIDDAAQPHFTSSAEALPSVVLLYALAAIERVGDAAAPVLSQLADANSRLWSDPVRWEVNDGLTTNLKYMVNPYEAPISAALWQAALSVLPNFSGFNNSATRYFMGGINPSRGQVLVTRFKAPTVADPDRNEAMLPSTSTSKQVRYWSACLNNTLSLYVSGCIKDSKFALGADGYVTLVISSTSTAPAGPNGVRAANWLKNGSPNELLLIRYMWATPGFAEAPNYYTGNAADLGAIATFSKAYYPQSTYCSLSNYAYNTCRWKFSAAQEVFYATAPNLFKLKYGQ